MAKIKPGNLTPVNPIVVPEVPPTDDVVFPKGTIQTMRPNATHAYGIPWSQISRWWSQFKQAATEWHIDPLELAAMAVIESSGQHYTTGEMTGNKDQVISRPDGTPVPSIGIMQVKPQYHQWRVPNVDAYTPLGNMVMSAAILAQGAQTYGSIDSAILNIYFPADDPNGTTQAAYLQAKKNLIAEIRGGVTPAPPPTDPYRIIFKGDYPPVQYGFLDDVGIPSYDFVVGHGGTKNTQHSGDDVPVPYGTKLFAPMGGIVRCVGDSGNPDWGQSCGAYNDTGGAGPGGARLGVGNITILLDSGHKLTLGHCRTATVSVGQRVKQGDQVGTSGGQDGAHCHVEVSVQRNGTYWLLDPIPALVAALGGKPIDTRPLVKFAGAASAVPLSVPFRIVLLDPAQKNQRPGTTIKPNLFVVHETDNYNPGMGAAAHLHWLQGGAVDNNGKSQKLGFHFCIDQNELIQFIPGTENAWHGGDGGGRCNMQSLAMEICVNDKNQYKTQTRANAEESIAAICMAFNIPEIEMHGWCCEQAHAGGDCHYGCPASIKADNYFPTMLKNIQQWQGGSGSTPVPSYANAIAPPDFTGDDVQVNNVTFRALQRNFIAKQDGVPALQYADLKSAAVREPLRKGEKFRVLFIVTGADNKDWLVTSFGSRIPASLCEPVFTRS
jgi:murein DD-endopeptidase MepM/ murein hydrolase activator NlpD